MAQPDNSLPLPSLRSVYDSRVASGLLRHDEQQCYAIEALQALLNSSVGMSAPSSASWLKRIFSRPTSSFDGVYIYGDVGRGKSVVMDLFFAHLPITAKKRMHFHAFMLDIHRRLHAFRSSNEDDALPRVIDALADEISVLCLDEFQVSDVTDAMILSRLFSGLFERGVKVVITSNRHPQDLYQGGLQRDQFLKFVALAEKQLKLVSINSPHDYRLLQLQSMQRTYVTPLDGESELFLLNSWNLLTGGEMSRRLDIKVQGRTLRIDKHYSGVAWLTFDELCARALGAEDYLELAKLCHTLLLQNIPRMSAEDRNEAKRFVTLIDALYEHKVKLLCSAEVLPEQLYPAGDGAFEFARTASRLIEMQSASYLALAHIG